MFGFVINKLKNRKWLNLCLLMGVALFIALLCATLCLKGCGQSDTRQTFYGSCHTAE